MKLRKLSLRGESLAQLTDVEAASVAGASGRLCQSLDGPCYTDLVECNSYAYCIPTRDCQLSDRVCGAGPS